MVPSKNETRLAPRRNSGPLEGTAGKVFGATVSGQDAKIGLGEDIVDNTQAEPEAEEVDVDETDRPDVMRSRRDDVLIAFRRLQTFIQLGLECLFFFPATPVFHFAVLNYLHLGLVKKAGTD